MEGNNDTRIAQFKLGLLLGSWIVLASFNFALAETRINLQFHKQNQFDNHSSTPPLLLVQNFAEAQAVYETIKDTVSIEILEEFIQVYPDTFYAKLAKLRIKEIKARNAQNESQNNQQGSQSTKKKENSEQNSGDPIELATFGSWIVYKYYKENGVATCYLATSPIRSHPSDHNHGAVYFMLTRYAEKSGFEPSFTTGYNFENSSSVTINIDNQRFRMFTQDNGAWLRAKTDERNLVSKMREASEMRLDSFDRNGTSTSYRFDIEQAQDALNSIQNCS